MGSFSIKRAEQRTKNTFRPFWYIWVQHWRYLTVPIQTHTNEHEKSQKFIKVVYDIPSHNIMCWKMFSKMKPIKKPPAGPKPRSYDFPNFIGVYKELLGKTGANNEFNEQVCTIFRTLKNWSLHSFFLLSFPRPR